MSEEHHESLMEKIADKVHGHDSSSSSSEDESEKNKVVHGHVMPSSAHVPPPEVVPPTEVSAVSSPPSSSSSPSMKSKIYRLFGRQQPVHKVLGGGKRSLRLFPPTRGQVVFLHVGAYFSFVLFVTTADVFLWKNKKISATVLSVATVIWFLFELLEYHLLNLVCHILIFSLSVLFLWSNASSFINKAPPRIPDVHIPENALLEFASALRSEINRALAVLRDIASGKDLKKFLSVIAGLWVVSVVGGWFNFLTLVYLLFVLLHTVPVLYEKYENQVDAFAEKASLELKKHYAVVNEKVLSKIPRGPPKDKKFA